MKKQSPANDETPASAAHHRLWEQLAWVAAGSASPAEQAQVQAHVASCAHCRQELALQQRICQGLQASAAAPHSAEPALQRMLARIDAGAPLQAQPRPGRGTAALQRWLAAAVVVQAVALAAAGAALWQRGAAGDGAEYRTLTSAAAPTRALLRLVPAPGLELGVLQALLARHGLVVVETSADGRAFGLAPAGEPGADLAVLVQRLRAEPGVLLAEPAAGP